MYIQFEWDPVKNRINQGKHGVSFEEAQTVFYDEQAIEFDDPDHSKNEDRYLILGISAHLRVLMVCYCVREVSSIRIISARKATTKESAYYEEINR